MKTLLVGLLLIGSAVALGAPDRSGRYECTCELGSCTPAFSFSYNKDNQFVVAESVHQKVSGYVTRQEQKGSGDVYLSLPGVGLTRNYLIVFRATGEIRTDDEGFTCLFKK